MTMFSDLLAKAQQLEYELAKFTQGELQTARDLAAEIKQNLEHEVHKEVGAPPASTPQGEPTAGVQSSGDLTG